MAQYESELGEGPMQHEDRDRNPTGSPEKVQETSRKAQKDLHTPKEQPDHNKPEPEKDFSDNQNESDMS